MEKKQMRRPESVLKNMRQNGCQNVIVLTSTGLQKISSTDDWLAEKQLPGQHDSQSTIINSAAPYNKSIKATNSSVNFSKTLHSSAQNPWPQAKMKYSRKILNKHQTWNETIEGHYKHLSRQVLRRNNEKSEQYEWPLVLQNYRRDLGGIFQNWDQKKEGLKIRARERVGNIYRTKYGRNTHSEFRETGHKKDRSFFEPARPSIINYRKSAPQEKQNQQNGTFYCLAKI